MEAAFVRCLSQLTIRSPGCLRSAPSTTKRISHRATSKVQLGPSPNSHARSFATAPVLLQDEKAAALAPLSSSPPPPRPTSDATASTRPAQPVSKASQPQPRQPGTASPTSAAPSPARPSRPLTRDEEVAQQMDKLFARHSPKSTSSPSRPRSNYDYYGGSSSSTSNPLFSRSGNTDPLSFLSPAPSPGTTAADVKNNAALNSLLTFQFHNNSPTKREAPLRLKPSLGKTLEVTDNFGLNRAFPTLEARINKNGNSVKIDLLNQRYHVRRGMKKKVYKRVRGREMFMQGFLGECARVRRMIKQGW